MEITEQTEAHKQEKSLLEIRREEVAFYTGNIETCIALLGTLPDGWPEHLAQYRTAPDKHWAAAQIDDLDDVELFGLLTLRDDLQGRVRAETFERAKAAANLALLETQEVTDVRTS